MREENIPYPSQRQTGDRIERSSLFSYACGRCGRCCRGTLIQTNPYEIAVLAQHLGTSTTAIIANYLDGVHLRHQGDGRCIFLSDQGCEVHSARPFVCRLYPLGHVGTSNGEESFVPIPPQPLTAGSYGESGTVADWLIQQNIEPMMIECDSYVILFRELFAAFAAHEGDPLGIYDWPEGAATIDMPELLDIDAMLMAECPEDIPITIEGRVARHQEILRKIFGLDPENRVLEN